MRGLIPSDLYKQTIVLDESIVIKDCYIDQALTFTNENFKVKSILFKNVKFRNKILFSGTDIKNGVGFIKCEFNETLVFQSIVSKTLGSELFNPYYSSNVDSIFFNFCVFNSMLYFIGKETQRDISFNKSEFNEGLIIDKTISKGRLKFNSTTIKNKFDLTSLTFQDISFKDCNIQARTRFNLCKLSMISFIKCIVDSELFFWNCDITKSFIFNKGVYSSKIEISCVYAESLTIAGGDFKETVDINYQNTTNSIHKGFNKLYLMSCSFSNGIYFKGTDHFLSQYYSIESIHLTTSSLLTGDINFNNLDVEVIEITGVNSKANFKFDSVFPHYLKIEDFINYGNLSFFNLRASIETKNNKRTKYSALPSNVHINRSNLGKTQFFSSNFDSFEQILLHNSIVSDIITSNVKWFKTERLRSLGSLNESNVPPSGISKKLLKNKSVKDSILLSYLSKKEIFRQLKYAMDKQGDRVQSLEFHRHEMNNYRQYLEIENSKGNFGNRIILCLSQTNNFGQDWLKATWIGLIILFILYIPIAVLGSNELSLSLSLKKTDIIHTLIELCWNQIPVYFQLLNPTHLITRIYNHDLPKCIHVFDFFHRIVLAYFIFQIISAFRKYVK